MKYLPSISFAILGAMFAAIALSGACATVIDQTSAIHFFDAIRDWWFSTPFGKAQLTFMLRPWRVESEPFLAVAGLAVIYAMVFPKFPTLRYVYPVGLVLWGSLFSVGLSAITNSLIPALILTSMALSACMVGVAGLAMSRKALGLVALGSGSLVFTVTNVVFYFFWNFNHVEWMLLFAFEFLSVSASACVAALDNDNDDLLSSGFSVGNAEWFAMALAGPVFVWLAWQAIVGKSDNEAW